MDVFVVEPWSGSVEQTWCEKNMNHLSDTARYISGRIEASQKSDHQIAKEAGFGTASDVSLIKAGTSQLPIGNIGKFAQALDADPVELLTMCLQEYYPETWESISPFLDTVLTTDEISLVKTLRFAVGGPYVMALTPKERKPLDEFLQEIGRAHV